MSSIHRVETPSAPHHPPSCFKRISEVVSCVVDRIVQLVKKVFSFFCSPSPKSRPLAPQRVVPQPGPSVKVLPLKPPLPPEPSPLVPPRPHIPVPPIGPTPTSRTGRAFAANGLEGAEEGLSDDEAEESCAKVFDYIQKEELSLEDRKGVIEKIVGDSFGDLTQLLYACECFYRFVEIYLKDDQTGWCQKIIKQLLGGFMVENPRCAENLVLKQTAAEELKIFLTIDPKSLFYAASLGMHEKNLWVKNLLVEILIRGETDFFKESVDSTVDPKIKNEWLEKRKQWEERLAAVKDQVFLEETQFKQVEGALSLEEATEIVEAFIALIPCLFKCKPQNAEQTEKLLNYVSALSIYVAPSVELLSLNQEQKSDLLEEYREKNEQIQFYAFQITSNKV